VPDYQLATFTGLRISYDATRTVKAGIEIEDGQFLLPLAQHPWHMADTQSYCVVVNAPAGGRIIIPCLELVRFYFGSSASLLHRIFDPQLKKEDLFTSRQLEPTYGMLELGLATGISRGSAADVGRIALDTAAWSTAKAVGKSCLSASAVGQPVYPKGHFPFSGETTLSAAGKWIVRDDGPPDFVVFSLRSCSHPFPFESLRYTLAGTAGNLHIRTSAQSPSDAQSGRASRKRSPRDQNLQEKDPGQALTPRTAYLGARVKFPDLLQKPVSERATVEGTGPSESAGSGRKREGSIGDPSGSALLRPTEVTEGVERAAPPKFLEYALQLLLRIDDVDFVVLTRSERAWAAPLPPRADADGVVERRIHLKYDPNEPIRQYSVVLVRKGDSCALVVVIEDDPPYLWVEPGDQSPAAMDKAIDMAVLMTLLPTAPTVRLTIPGHDLVARLEMILGPLTLS
jgi:hypothetical protein